MMKDEKKTKSEVVKLRVQQVIVFIGLEGRIATRLSNSSSGYSDFGTGDTYLAGAERFIPRKDGAQAPAVHIPRPHLLEVSEGVV